MDLQLTAHAAARDKELLQEGWERRFVGGPPRLAEMVEVYGDLGLEVRLEALHEEDLDEKCAGCALAMALFRIVYTRRPA